jgi:prevent-host-death family protein
MMKPGSIHRVSLTDARARLSELVELAENGETVQITRHGKPMAQLSGVRPPRRPIMLDDLRRLTDAMTPHSETAGSFIRKLRDGDRY